MRRDDADDFRQTVHLRLIERGDVLARFEGRSALKTYLTVVVRRLLIDWQNRHLGKWRPSAAARRLGPVGEHLERLLHRDRYSLNEALALLRSRHAELDAATAIRLASAVPARIPPRMRLAQAQVDFIDFQDPIEERMQHTCAARRRLALARALRTLPPPDRRLIFLRYRQRLTVQAIARRHTADPKALYRRFDKVLRQLRSRLVADGIDAV